jgi:hypothetical protein
MGILTLFLFLAAGHVFVAGFATVLRVTAGLGVLRYVLRTIKGHRCRGNGHRSGTGQGHQKHFDFSHYRFSIQV